MGRIGRFACIFVPMVCTIISLLCCVLLMLAGTNKNLKALEPYYLLKINTKDFEIPSGIDIIPGSKLGKYEPLISTGVKKQEVKIEDFYYSYLWNYCAGDISQKDGKENFEVKKCSKSGADYVFDIVKIVNDRTKGEVNFPDAVSKVQKSLNIVSKFMVSCYILGIIAAGATFIVGWFGLLSRWGSCVTTVFADITFFLLFIASGCSTAVAYSVAAAFNKAFEDFKVEATVGKNWQMTTWVGTAFAFGAALFWLMSTCCCSARTQKVMNEKNTKTVKVEHTPYTYERVASPYSGSHGAPSQGSYEHKKGLEPMRHAHV